MHGVCMCDLCEEAVNQQKSSMNLHLLATLQHRHILLLLLCLSRLNPLHLSSSVHPTQEKNYKDRVCSLYTQTMLIESYIYTRARAFFGHKIEFSKWPWYIKLTDLQSNVRKRSPLLFQTLFETELRLPINLCYCILI